MVFLLFSSTEVDGYSESTGIEDGDVISVEYEGKYADTLEVFDFSPPGSPADFTITTGPGGIIQGFYDGLLGLKVGDSKEINIPVGKGYSATTAPTPELADRELVFNVFIHGVVVDVNGDDDDSSSGLFDTISTWIKVIGGIGLGIFVIIGLNGLRSKTSIAACDHCKSLGRSTKSEGKCSTCGNFYCRASFGRGCPNCKGNSFIPN